MPDIQIGRAEPLSTGRGPLYVLDGILPRVDPTAFIAPTAAVIEEGGMLSAGGRLTPGKVIGRYELWTGHRPS